MNSLLCAALAVLGLPQDDGPDFTVRIADDATITLAASWGPFEDWSLGTPEVVEHPALAHPTPAEPERTIAADRLRPFLPARAVELGEPWEVDREAVVALLTQLHPGATSEMSHGTQNAGGSHALLRAANERYLELLTRSHASIVLAEGVRLNPAQFEGRLLLDRGTGAVVAYRLHLPPRNTNVDVNVALDPGAGPFQSVVKIDLGYLPRMELAGGAWPAGLEWTYEVEDEPARKLLRERFYGAVDWLSFEDAVRRAREEDRPLHVVLVFGTFDDAAC